MSRRRHGAPAPLLLDRGDVDFMTRQLRLCETLARRILDDPEADHGSRTWATGLCRYLPSVIHWLARLRPQRLPRSPLNRALRRLMDRLYDPLERASREAVLVKEELAAAFSSQIFPSRQVKEDYLIPMLRSIRAWAGHVAMVMGEVLDVIEADALSEHVRDPELIARLMEFARQDQQEEFSWLARSAGVPDAEVEGLWRGTRGRLGGQNTQDERRTLP